MTLSSADAEGTASTARHAESIQAEALPKDCPTNSPLNVIPLVSGLDEARVLQALPERGHDMRKSANDVLRRNPITGIAGCCERAAVGDAAAAPPTSVMNSRRRMCLLCEAKS